MMPAFPSFDPKRIVEIHTKDEIAAEVERMRASPEMMWWLGLIYGYWQLRDDEVLRTEAYNRLTERM
jgi:hypothetical protein